MVQSSFTSEYQYIAIILASDTGMISMLHRKFTTAIRLYRTQGTQKVWSVISKKLRYFWAKFSLPLRPSHIVVDGCHFDLTDPLITTEAKIALFAGQYEEYERPAIRQFIPRNFPVIELGAGMGVVSCITNRLLTQPISHLVVEANPYVLKLTEQNRVRNNCQFTIVNAALGYDTAEITLFIDEAYFVFSNAKRPTSKSVQVRTMRLQQMIDQLDSNVVSVICDIEGMEVDLVEHEIEVLANHVAVFLFEEHSINVGQDAIDRVFKNLEQHDFERVHHDGDVHVFVNRRIFSQAV